MTEHNPPPFTDVMLGHKINLRFSNGHPPVTGIVEFVSDEFVSVGEKRFRWADVEHISLDLK